MNRRSRVSLMALALTACAFSAEAEPMNLEGAITDVIGQRIIVQGAAGKTLVDLGPDAANQTALKVGDKVAIEGDMKKDDQMHADRITASDGKVYEIQKKQSWLEWLTGKPKDDAMQFSAEQAKTLATGKGYTLTGDPVAEKKHFVATATKDGKAYEIDIHKDGSIEEHVKFDAADAKKLATDKGYALTSDPTPEKKHFTATATKDGKSVSLEMRRDGRIEEFAAFGPADAKKQVSASGYEVVGEPRPEKKHFEVLAKKDGKFYEVHAHRDGSLKGIRSVDKSDLKWGTAIQ